MIMMLSIAALAISITALLVLSGLVSFRYFLENFLILYFKNLFYTRCAYIFKPFTVGVHQWTISSNKHIDILTLILADINIMFLVMNTYSL